MAKPKVQSLDTIMGDLNQVFDPQRQHIQTRMDATPGRLESARMQLDATKQNQFRDINAQAAGQGQAFSGMPIAEQARYLGEQYLPGQQRLVEQEEDQMMQFEGMLAELLGQQRGQALDIRSQQQSTLEQFLEAERKRRHQEELKRMQQQWQARQSELDRAHEASLQRSRLAHQSSLQSQQQQEQRPTTQQMLSGARTSLSQVAGRDGYVSPSDYRKIRDGWIQAGGSPQAFEGYTWQFINPSHARDYTNNSTVLNVVTSMRR